MKAIPAILLSLIMLGCRMTNTAPAERVAGLVVEKRADTMTYESWNAPSDPYYVLETRDGAVTLRPSSAVPSAALAALNGKRVLLTGYHTDGEPYQPTQAGEAYPMEPTLGTNGLTEPVAPRPTNRGVGFVVTRILEVK